MVVHLLKATLAAALLTLLLTSLTILWLNYSVRRQKRVDSWGVTVSGAVRFVVGLYLLCLALSWFVLGHSR